MKVRMIVGAALVAIFAGIVVAADATKEEGLRALDSKNGFRDARFGSDVSSFKGLTRVPEPGDTLKFYTRQGDQLALGGAKLSKIVYGFYKGKLGSIFIEAGGVECYALFDALRSSYGKPLQPNPYIEQHYWLGKVVSGNFERNSPASTCKMIFMSTAVQKKQDDDQNAAAESAKKDLR